ncbi:hypothetical protein [Nocardia sp. NPDC058705]|uniref:hypothetical protein n=1 Tax=Nocardia sp. NPDC058705 TaxID=3346609 RepID=UPI00367E102A
MSDEQATPEVTDLGEIPPTLAVAEVSAATDARNKLLQAIGQEAQYVSGKSAGQVVVQTGDAAASARSVITGTSQTMRFEPAGAAEGLHCCRTGARWIH